MNRLSIACLVALAPVIAMANIIPTGTTITGSTGNYTWSYNLQLSSDQNINTGLSPASILVPHADLRYAGFLTLFDFAGYLPGSCAGPTGWVCTAQNVGFTPDDVVPLDDPKLPNLTWAYLTGPALLGQPNGLNLGVFSARSIFNSMELVSYAARGVKNNGSAVGTVADNVGSTQGPAANRVPEPSAAALAGLGLLILSLSSRCRRRTPHSTQANPLAG